MIHHISAEHLTVDRVREILENKMCIRDSQMIDGQRLVADTDLHTARNGQLVGMNLRHEAVLSTRTQDLLQMCIRDRVIRPAATSIIKNKILVLIKTSLFGQLLDVHCYCSSCYIIYPSKRRISPSLSPVKHDTSARFLTCFSTDRKMVCP